MPVCHAALSRLLKAGTRVFPEKFSYETGEMDLGGGGGGERDGADRSAQEGVAFARRERKFSITEPLGGFRNTGCTSGPLTDIRSLGCAPAPTAIHPKGGDLRNANFATDRLILLTVDGVLNGSVYFDLTSCRPLLHPVLRNEQGGSQIFQKPVLQWGLFELRILRPFETNEAEQKIHDIWLLVVSMFRAVTHALCNYQDPCRLGPWQRVFLLSDKARSRSSGGRFRRGKQPPLGTRPEGETECSDRRFYTVAATPAQVGIALGDGRRFVGGLLIPPVCRAPILIETDLV
jgi:hypothetical protein